MNLSIVIVNWNTRDLLATCLESVLVSPGHAEREVLVVDNASTDGSARMVRERFPQVDLIENQTNVGFACANNQAIQRCRGRYVLLLNSDTRVMGNALEVLEAFMEGHPRAGAAGAKLLNADGSLQPSVHPMLTPAHEFWRLIFLDNVIHRATYGAEFWKATQPRPVEVIKGACLMLRREALSEIGLLDESYFMYTEEVDLCYRLARAGWQLWWVPTAWVTHYGEASSRQVAQDMYIQLYRSKIQFYRKFGGGKRAGFYKWLVRLAYWPRLGVAAVAALFSPPLAGEARLFRRLLTELRNM
jgi:N-acetylglucosaminyl-diphospho-decaprenol L-rhamnosyltransferase